MSAISRMMRYTYTSAWSIIGGISLPNGTGPIELSRFDHGRFVLTRDPDDMLADVDRATALGCLALRGLFAERCQAEFPAALASEIEAIKAERRKKARSHAVLVFEVEGDIEASITKRSHKHDDFVVSFDVVDKQAIRRKHRGVVNAMKLALAYEGVASSRFALLSDGVFLTDVLGQTVYSLGFTMSGDLSVSTPLTCDGEKRVAARFGALRKAADIDRVQRLLSQMADSESDRLRAFLSGWAGLEILIAKAFNTYEEVFLSPLESAGQPVLRRRFLDRIKDVMKARYRSTDKFLVVSDVLFPTVTDAAVNDDLEVFSRLKKIRDSMYHGEEFCEEDLPVHELAALLRKYMLAYVQTPDPAIDADRVPAALPSPDVRSS